MNLTHPGPPKSTFKQGMVSLIWIYQTRADVGVAIPQMATQVAESCESATKAKALPNLYNKIVKFAKHRPRAITYSPYPGNESGGKEALEAMINWKPIVFDDAGFGKLVKNHIVESNVVIFGDVI